MDLPTCPACGQSVLDDDVDECPFCGSSMTGKASAANRPPKTARAATPNAPAAQTADRSKPQRASSGPSTAAQSKSAGAEDDPFSLEASSAKAAARQVVPLHPKPQKGRTHRVVCPMCETVGYTARKAAGKEVRCANPKCLVPIFTAPALPKEEPVEESPEKPPLPQPVMIALAAGLIVIVAGAVWFFMLREDGSTPADVSPGGFAGGTISDPDRPDDNSTEGNPEKPPEGGDPDAPGAAGPTAAEMRTRVLALMPEAARESHDATRLKARQLTALAFAEAGDLDGSRKQLERLRTLARANRATVYEVQPLVAIAWQELKPAPAGSAGQAKATIDEGLGAFRDLPPGRVRIDSATALAAILCAVGREDEARRIIEEHNDPGPTGRLSAHLQAIRSLETFDLDASVSDGPLAPWSAPQWVAVTFDLAGRGRRDRALAWARRAPRGAARSESVTAWAEALAAPGGRAGRPGLADQIDAATKELDPAAQAGLYARVAVRLHEAGEKDDADEMLTKSHAALASIAVPPPVALPDSVSQGLDVNLPDSAGLKGAAVAAAEVARAETRFGRPAEAWKALELSLGFARAAAPSPAAVERLIDRARATNNFAVRGRLDRMLDVANDRLALQASLLRAAVGWRSVELAKAVWTEIQSRADESDPNRKEAYGTTAVPWILRNEFRDAGLEELAAAAGEMARQPAGAQARLELAKTLIESGTSDDLRRAVRVVADENFDRTWREQWAAQLGCRLVNADKLDAALEFLPSIKDPFLRIEASGIVPALAVRKDRARELWESLAGSRKAELRLDPASRVAFCYGFVTGLRSTADAADAEPGSSQTSE